MGSSEKIIKYPVAGISSIVLGYIITNLSSFNIHNLEGLIWALIMLGLWIILPTSMLIKSIGLIINSQRNKKNKVRSYSILLTAILGLLLTSMLIMSLWTKYK